MRRFHSLFCVLIALAMAGCATFSEIPQPKVDIPNAYREPPPVNPAPLALDWWTAFSSSELSTLMAAAIDESPDLAVAVERVRQAEAQVRVAGASLFPQLSLGAITSLDDTDGGGSSSQTSKGTSATLNASYEVDVWGANAAGVRSAESFLDATRFDRETVRLTLLTGVASAYFQVLSLRGRLSVAQENIAIAERVLNVVEVRARNGVASALDLARQRSAVLSQRAAIPPLELQERQTLAALAILIGRTPESFNVVGDSVTGLAMPLVAPGLPAELLVRRPDLAAAEAQLAAANADIAVARAALLPSVQLTASAGLSNTAFMSLATPHTAAYSLAASVLQTIFDGGRLRAQVDIAESQERELVESYRKTILTALADVENALVATSRTAQQQDLQTAVVQESRRALRLAEVRYREGADDLLTVLDAQRTLFQAEDQLGLVQLDRLQASVSLYKALGGGWQMPAVQGSASP